MTVGQVLGVDEPLVGGDPLGVAGEAVLEAHALQAGEHAIDVTDGDFELLAALHCSLVEDVLVELERDVGSRRHKVGAERHLAVGP